MTQHPRPQATRYRSKGLKLTLLGLSLVVLAGCGNNAVTPTPPTPTPTPAPTPAPTPSPTPGPTPNPAPTPGGNAISGGVVLSGASDLSGIYVIGCLSETDCPATTVTDASGGYVLADLQALPYTLIAWADMDGDQSLNSGDYLGVYSQDGSSATPLTPPQEAANITLAPYGDGGSTPEPEPTEGSISGTLTAPGDVAGSWVVIACYYTESGCDESSSVQTDPVTQPGSSLPYSVSGLSAGQYVIIAVADADGNGSFEDAGDYIGLYPASQERALVSPPATGIDVQLLTNAEFGTSASTPLSRSTLRDLKLR